MVPVPENTYPRKINGIWVVGKVEYFISSGCTKSTGSFLLTKSMAEELEALKKRAEAL